MTTTPTWRLRLLGSFQLERDGQVVARFTRHKPDLLLAVIALGGHQYQSRVEVAARLWPDSRRNLRQNRLTEVLFRLNRELRAAAGDDTAFIDTDYVIIRLSPQVHTDVQEFEDLLGAATTTADAAQRAPLLEQAMALYGTGLLPLIADPAVHAEQERLRAARAYAAQLLVDILPAPALSGAASHAAERVEATELAQYYLRGKQLRAGGVGVGPAAPPRYDVGETLAQEPAPLRPFGPEDLAHCVQMAEEAEPHLFGPERAIWLDRLDVRRAEIYAGIEWGLAHPAGIDGALRIGGALWRYWHYRGRHDEGLQYLQQALAASRQVDSRMYTRAAHGAAALAVAAGDLERAEQWFREALAGWRRLEDVEAIGRVLVNLGLVAYKRGDFAAARAAYAEGLPILRREGRETLLAEALGNAALVEIDDNDFAASAPLLEEQLAIGRRLKDDRTVAWTLVNLAGVVRYAQGYDQVRANTAEALRLFQGLGDFVGVATCLRLQGWLAQEQGQLHVAEALHQASYAICSTNREERGIGESLRCLAEVSQLRGDTAEAIARYRQATALLRDAAEGALAGQAQSALDELVAAGHEEPRMG